MRITRSIRLKALLMLVAFAASFTVFCHCGTVEAAAVVPHHCCCEKKTPPPSGQAGCTGMQAVKFNLVEKQVASPTQLKQLQVTMAVVELPAPGASSLPARHLPLPLQWPDKHSPPDLLTFYQCFLI
jgi:hypothetical protein